MPHELNASIQVTLPDDPRAMAMAIAKVGPDAAWQVLVAAAHAWAEHLDQWDKFKFQTDHGLVYVSIGRAAECPDSFDEMPGDDPTHPPRPTRRSAGAANALRSLTDAKRD